MRDILASGLFSLALCAAAQAGPIAVDGNVADWGISVGDGNTSNLSAPAVSGAAFFAFAREDQNDLAGDSGYLGPNYGGQNYDVEPSCGNDVLLVHDDIPSARVPEPATLAALGIGNIGLAFSRRRK
jgi:hypothetical protein